VIDMVSQHRMHRLLQGDVGSGKTIVALFAALLAIGTHALVQERTKFGRLGFVAVDEQHRFGVEQRKALGAKGERPDVLLLSATPIPRSLALTLYGDLDVSVLDERPPGRLPVATALRPESARERVLQFIDREIEKGRQAYVVYPVIYES
jgi:ATP-dependent DNA helicase RecG